MATHAQGTSSPRYFEEPRLAKRLFASRPAAWLWLLVRLYLGYEWLHAGLEKMFGSGHAAWMTTGLALKGFATNASTQLTKGANAPVAYGWYRAFLNWIAGGQYHWMGKMVAVSEVLIGAALILGLFTGIAAVCGVVLNFSYVFAGSAGVNPLYIVLGLGLIMAWRVAGYYGADRWVLRYLGTPGEPGSVFSRSSRLKGKAKPAPA